ncbi:MAG TPA: hypothetical protein VHZ32_12985 [Rhizomicrobium sp.]|jgi:hypothetical protein|nr:hypothetical protein [Rhizomicrobium sp.]
MVLATATLNVAMRAVEPSEVATLKQSIARQGYGVVENCFQTDELACLQAFARDAAETAKGEYAVFNGNAALANTVLGTLGSSGTFRALCRELYEAGTGRPGPEQGFYQVFRCLKGESGRRQSSIFHYDSYAVTVLFSILAPEQGPPGDLVLFPNRRTIRASYVRNLMDKFLVDNPLAQRLLRRRASLRNRDVTAIRLRPGHAYLFWGYRSLHANEACAPDQLRATALMHYGDPHAGSRFRNLIRNIRSKV